MDNSNLVKMANNIGAFFRSEPDRDMAIKGVEQHIRNFWEPRMHRQIIEYSQTHDNELMDIVAEAIHNIAKS
ncbi:formate dehydrogenase subunit delta [Methylomonas sp. AM2-LC]|uniref:formate dehydrogenase subunit delta n=1 Tax=Methylomonas sp. AM2-LC TaxID=3153301 RepID=UPI003266D5F2